MTSWKFKLHQIILVVFNLIALTKGHGRMLNPPQRGSLWRFGFDVPSNYNDNANYCGGVEVQWDKFGGKCGVCGDGLDQRVKDHEPGGKYALGIIGRKYLAGQTVNVTIDITANHLGFFEFRLCENDEKMRAVDQECFDRHLLRVANNNRDALPHDTKIAFAHWKDAEQMSPFRYFVPNEKCTVYFAQVELPKAVTCKYCVLQWKYTAGNNNGPAEKDGFGCLGCPTKQETFVNCADIRIEPDNSPKYEINKDENNSGNETLATDSSSAFKSTIPHPIANHFFLVILFVILNKFICNL